MTNWTKIINTVGKDKLQEFVGEKLSRADFLKLARGTDVNSDVRSLMNARGVSGMRTLAKKALSRR